ncbi:class I SAM-dependent methyltransferase [Paenibacillus sp. LMG 31459]|uniref:Class I SAM-dependent methyltransferase n=1 Tax=Paenibacillus phytohabitans TaxID=2654978 RepID=A0ABX1YER6_9BACL|nr:class I SAM-dependent methyltransferase [Paenibacillus phytohabitans]NOU79482.1 class I SAM-dependent methyltransferase [Paenibacillus phytohabitans]
MNIWNSSNPVFETDQRGVHIYTAWAGHRRFGYDLIRHMQPGTVVELGTYYGASFFSFCQAVKDQRLNTQCYAVDTWVGDKHAGFYTETFYESVRSAADDFYPGISHLLRMTFDEALREFPDKSIDVLHIDGLHTYEAVKNDYECWLPKLADNGIIMFHDITVTKDDFGVYRLWEELKELYPAVQFEHCFGLGILMPNGCSPITAHMLAKWDKIKPLYP